MPSGQANASNTWIMFALITVASWGVYGVFLNNGQANMADPVNGRYKAFLFVGIAYFLTAILAPLILLVMRGADWKMPASGMSWSLVAGIVGALGAFAVLLAYGAGGRPPAVMSIVFAGAPIVNVIVALLMHPPAGGFSSVKPPFVVGLVLAAVGAYMVTTYRPDAVRPHAAPSRTETKAPEKS